MRASRGYTFDPCPACKQPPKGSRAKDDICADCRRFLEAGKALADRQKADPRKAYWLPWFMPGYHDAECDHFKKEPPGLERFAGRGIRDAADWLRALLPELVLAIGEEVTGTEASGHRTAGARPVREAGGFVFHIARSERESAGGTRESVLLTEDQRELIRDIDRAIRITLAETAANSLEKGANLLGSLATGRITADDLDEETARDVGNRRRKAEKLAGLDP